ncbi:hypothetical protein [Klenkia sp. PcliD-1-E]|uniref:hypothetical protein n=1 Tax=Klenkia sp. PcliD-1-E TaxID=2954492 RepID=UPI002097F9BA|nr:hypothetical protein [Klenkia sp. PcliD-1-E]MCO7218369.1 hypothetical protein [Klenkia sp. PcliD-1-E]
MTSDEQRQRLLEQRVRYFTAVCAAIEHRSTVLDLVSAACDRPAAAALLHLRLGWDSWQCGTVLDMQIVEFTEQRRRRAAADLLAAQHELREW